MRTDIALRLDINFPFLTWQKKIVVNFNVFVLKLLKCLKMSLRGERIKNTRKSVMEICQHLMLLFFLTDYLHAAIIVDSRMNFITNQFFFILKLFLLPPSLSSCYVCVRTEENRFMLSRRKSFNLSRQTFLIFPPVSLIR